MKIVKLLLLGALLLSSLSVWARGSVPILMFHRVNDTFPPGETVVHTKRFIEHLDVIKTSGRTALTVTQLAELISRGEVPERAVVITFDDGRDDNFTAAKLLKNRNLTATFYITTSFFLHHLFKKLRL